MDVRNDQDEGAVGEYHRSVSGANLDAEREIVGCADGGGAEFGGHGLEQMGVSVGPDEEGEVEVGYVASSTLDSGIGGIGATDREGICRWVWCSW